MYSFLKVYEIKAERGELINFVKTPKESKMVAIKLLVGDYHRNFNYVTSIGFPVRLPDEENPDEYRRLLWLQTDQVYKDRASQFRDYQSQLKLSSVSKKELELDDFSKIKPIVQDYGTIQPLRVNKKWEEDLKALSKIFKSYPEITNSYCLLSTNCYEDYLVSSEGTVIRKPDGAITLSIYASSEQLDDDPIYDSYSFVANDINGLPSVKTIRLEIEKIIKRIRENKTAKSFEGSYLGPILFENEATANLINNVFSRKFIATRNYVVGRNYNTDIAEKLGQKFVSSDLSVVALPKLKIFNGTKLTGAYEIDDEGVVPPDSLILIKNGILNSLLNDRTPTHKFPVSQGFRRNASSGVSPGTIRLISSKTTPHADMKKKLMSLGKEQGLPFVYIVRDELGNSQGIYRVSVADGKEECVNQCTISRISIPGMRRFITASDRLKVWNWRELSLISPESLIIDEMEIEKVEKGSRPKYIIVSNPLLDMEKKQRSTQK